MTAPQFCFSTRSAPWRPGLLAVAGLAAWLLAPSMAWARIRPGAARLSAPATVRASGSVYTFQVPIRGHVATYRVDVGDPDVAQGLLRVEAAWDRGPFLPVVVDAGTRYRDASGRLFEPGEAAGLGQPRLLSHGLEGSELVLRYQEQPGARQLTKEYRIALEGAALRIRFSAPPGPYLDGYAGVSLGHAEVSEGQAELVPYLPSPVLLLPGDLVGICFLDRSRSLAGKVRRRLGWDAAGRLHGHEDATLLPDTQGETAGVEEWAYLVVSDRFEDLWPTPDAPSAPGLADLRGRLVLDVWGLHTSFGVHEGVAVVWTAQEPGEHHLAVTAADGDPSCGDGILVRVVSAVQGEFGRILVPNGQTQEQTWERLVSLAQGEEVWFRVERRANNGCDGTSFHVEIHALDAQETYDSIQDFCSEQGHRGFSYYEVMGDRARPMTWSNTNNRWEGRTAFSFLGRGFCHPGQGADSYGDARAMVARYVEYGMRNLAVIFHVWQRWGYDAGLPDHYPANPNLGDDQELAAFIQEAEAAGMLVALHENYTDMYPDNPPDYPSPLWNPEALALAPDGSWKPAWYNAATGQQSYRIAPQHMLDYASRESPEIARGYGPNAAYLDVTPGANLEITLDSDAGESAVPALAAAYADATALFSFLRENYGGPLLGEGSDSPLRYDTWFAGWVQAVERQVEGRRHCLLAPDYELQAIRPLMANHGMGYYGRYVVSTGQENPSVEELDLDHYRVTEIAFGHTGFLGDGVSGVEDWVDFHFAEYWLLQALQVRYGAAQVESVDYWDGSRFVTLAAVLRRGLDLRGARLRIQYASGLTIFVNRAWNRVSASSFEDFSWRQGRFGWSYFEDLGSGLRPMSWDPAGERWRGQRRWSSLTQWGGHPDGGAVVRLYELPRAGQYRVRGEVQDQDTSCGDGVRAAIRVDGSEVWSCRLPEEDCSSFETTISGAAGSQVQFRIEERANNYCDSTKFLVEVESLEEQAADWAVDTSAGRFRMPSPGFLAVGSDGFRAGTVRLEDRDGAAAADFVRAPEYRFARSRSGLVQDVFGLRTDGQVAVSIGRSDSEVHLVQATRAEDATGLLVAVSVRADVNASCAADGPAAWNCRLAAHRAGEATELAVTLGALPRSLAECLRAQGGSVAVQGAREARLDAPAAQVEVLGLVPEGEAVLSLSCGETICGDGACTPGVEDCFSCPEDCEAPDGKVCCDPDEGAVSGECCTDADCSAGTRCRDHWCLPAGGDGQGPDAGTKGATAGGCGCSMGRPRVLWPWFVLLVAGVWRRRH